MKINFVAARTQIIEPDQSKLLIQSVLSISGPLFALCKSFKKAHKWQKGSCIQEM